MIHDAAIVFDPEREVVLDVNARACEVYGRPRNEFVGLSLRDISRDPVTGATRVLETLGSQAPNAFRTIQYRSDGEELRLAVRAAAVDFQGRKAILTINREVETAEIPLERIEKIAGELQFTLDSIPAAVLLLDADCRILRMNRRAFAMTSGGDTPDEVAGSELAAVTSGEPWVEADRLVRLAMSNNIELSAKVEDAPSGRTWSVAVRLAPRGGETRAILVISDLTAMVDLEAEVRRIDQMAEFGRVVAGVAHEVRTPLFALSTTIEVIEQSIDQEDERARRRLDMMRDQITRLNVLMRDLLDYGKAPALDVSLQTLDQSVREAVALVAESAASRDVRLENGFRGDDVRILIDEPRMVTALRNLLENAIQHAPAGSTVTIRGGATPARDHVCCIVEDLGRGFPAEHLSSVMEPFFTRRAGGTGLGLAIVQRVVELHGGRVTVENRSEAGARVTVSLPRAV